VYDHPAARSRPDRLTLTITEAAGLLGISRGLAYELAARGELPVLRLGRRMVIPRKALAPIDVDVSEKANAESNSTNDSPGADSTTTGNPADSDPDARGTSASRPQQPRRRTLATRIRGSSALPWGDASRRAIRELRA